MQYYESLADLVGGTPLVRLKSLTRPRGPIVLAKVEYLNPGGSVKDRVALRMLEAAEQEGLIGPGSTIVEPTSGNTGGALAMLARLRGYQCVTVCQEKVSAGKVAVLRAFGAEVVLCPDDLSADDPDCYLNVAARLALAIPGAWMPDQYSNNNNPAAHYTTTGPEIWHQTAGRITHFVTALGTGGTASGAGRFLKETSSAQVLVIGVDPQGSIYSGGHGGPSLVEAVGESFYPAVYDRGICDEIVSVSDRECFSMTRRLALEDAMLVGPSSGLAAVAASRVASRLGAKDVLVVLFPDSGRSYLTKVFDDTWLDKHGLLDPVPGHTLTRPIVEAAALGSARISGRMVEKGERCAD